MKKLRKYNRNRRIARSGTYSPQELENLSKKIKYTGNPVHKRNPGDYGLTPPARHRKGKTLCDTVKIFSQEVALKYLRVGLERGAVSELAIDGWPNTIWSVTEDGTILEAKRDGDGTYHGYPLLNQEPMAVEVKKFWSKNG